MLQEFAPEQKYNPDRVESVSMQALKTTNSRMFQFGTFDLRTIWYFGIDARFESQGPNPVLDRAVVATCLPQSVLVCVGSVSQSTT